MKNKVILVPVIFLVLSITINILQYRKHLDPNPSKTNSTLISLLEKRADAEKEMLQRNMTRYDVASLNQQIDNLYWKLINENDIEAFKQILNVDLHYAKSMGVFGIMEIANRNYSERPDINEEEIREHAFLELAKLTGNSNANVRGMALFALGKCRRYEHKEIVAKCLNDTADVGIRWLPLCSKSTTDGLTTSVGYMARFALKEMLGPQAGLEYIKEKRTKNSEDIEPLESAHSSIATVGGWTPRYKTTVICFVGELGSRSNAYTHASNGNMTCGYPGKVSKLEWKFIERRDNKDVYNFKRIFPFDAVEHTLTEKTVEYVGKKVVVFKDEYHVVVMDVNGPDQ